MEFKRKGNKYSIKAVLNEIKNFIKEKPEYDYVLYVSTDSQVHRKYVNYSSAIVCHREGNGAIEFIRTVKEKSKKKDLHFTVRIIKETQMSLNSYEELVKHNFLDELDIVDFVIDIDAGEEGDSKIILSSAVGMVNAQNITCRHKPYGLSVCSANKYTKK
jgi:predicted RNase H-related nuclease YkuK (DUF458 family)